jgi:hypothetical protein
MVTRFLDLSYRFRRVRIICCGGGSLRPMSSTGCNERRRLSTAVELRLRRRGYTLVSNVASVAAITTGQSLYGIKTDSDRLAVDAVVLQASVRERRWQIVGNVLWGEDDSDVDFHDTEAFQISLGALYRFGAAGRATPVVEDRPY